MSLKRWWVLHWSFLIFFILPVYCEWMWINSESLLKQEYIINEASSQSASLMSGSWPHFHSFNNYLPFTSLLFLCALLSLHVSLLLKLITFHYHCQSWMWRWCQDGVGTPGDQLSVQRIEGAMYCQVHGYALSYENLNSSGQELLYFSVVLVQTGWLSYYCLPCRAVSECSRTVAGLWSEAVSVAQSCVQCLTYSLSTVPNKITLKWQYNWSFDNDAFLLHLLTASVYLQWKKADALI